MQPANNTNPSFREYALDHLADFVYEVSEGNIGAMRVCVDIIKDTSASQVQTFFSQCNALGLRGWKIWSAYQHSDQDYNKLIQNVTNADAQMMAAIKTLEQEMS